MDRKFGVKYITEDFESQHKERRDCYDEVFRYLTDDGPQARVCALYGLRRTGKSVVMEQCAEHLPAGEKTRAIMIECTSDTDVYQLFDFIEREIKNGYRYFFIDEITYAQGFQRVGEVFANLYVGKSNARIVLAGTDSLGLSLSSVTNMYDRILFVPTTHISFAEYSRLVGCKSIDDYVELGSTLKKDSYVSRGELVKYVETSVVDNIINSLEKSEGVRRYPPALTELYDEKLLRNCIHRIINDYGERTTAKILRKAFHSAMLGSARDVLAKREDESRLNVDNYLDDTKFNERIAEHLGVVPYDPRKLEIKQEHYEALVSFLYDVDVFLRLPVLISYKDRNTSADLEIISHPGMFHANFRYVLDALQEDGTWFPEAVASPEIKATVYKAAREWAIGSVMEKFMLADVYYLLCGSKRIDKENLFSLRSGKWFVSKLHCEVKEEVAGETRMVPREADIFIFNKDTKEAYLFEVKHSSEHADEQSRHLESQAFARHVEEHFGPIKGRAVLYNGVTDGTHEIPRISAKDFLLQLYEDFYLGDFSPEKTLLKLSPENVGAYKWPSSVEKIDDQRGCAEEPAKDGVSVAQKGNGKDDEQPEI